MKQAQRKGVFLGSDGRVGKVLKEDQHPLPRFWLPLLLQSVGCDFEIDSGAMEDRCGVCRGNGSTCHTVSGIFEEAEGQGMEGTTMGVALDLGASLLLLALLPAHLITPD